MLTSKPQSFYIINLLSHQTNVTRIVLVFFPHLSSPLPLPTHCAAVPPQRPLIRKCDLALCTFDATSPLPPPLPPICTPVMSAPFICETEQRKDPSTDKDFGSPLSVIVSSCPPPLSSCHPLFLLFLLPQEFQGLHILQIYLLITHCHLALSARSPIR